MNTAHTRPRFRTDLVAQPLDEGGQRFVDVTDPDSGNTFRFYEVEYSIACAMDGRRDLTGLAEWAQAELGLSPTPEELLTVISTLADLGYLASSSPAGGATGDGFDLGFAGAAPGGEPEEPLPSSDDIELGTAGKSPLDTDGDEAFEVPGLTLGFSGNEDVVSPDEAEQVLTPAAPQGRAAGGRAASSFETPPTPPPPDAGMRAVLRPMTPAGQAPDEDDGPTNLPPPASDFEDEMSVDLTDHMRIGTADVKEAVRQSRAMQAVEVPPVAAGAAAAGQSPAGVSEEALDKDDEPAAPRTKTRSPAAPTELPGKPARVSTAMEAGDSRSDDVLAPGAAAGGSRSPAILILVLVLVVAGAAAAYYFLYWQPQQAEGAAQESGASSRNTEPGVTPEATPPAPEPPSARLSLGASQPVEVKAARGGAIAEIVDSGIDVAEGDVVARLNGYRDVEKEMEKTQFDQRRYEKRIAEHEEKKATAAGNEPAIKRYQRVIDDTAKKLENENARLAEQQKELDTYVLRAPVAGALEVQLQARARVDVDQVVFVVMPPPALEATFDVSDETERAEGQEIAIASKADRSKEVTCLVARVDGKQVTVSCPNDGALAENDEVVLL